MTAPGAIDVNLLTGFLGSGKTTLLRRLLHDPSLSNAAVLINEFGDVGLDHHLIERINDTTVMLQSGCVCCTIRGDLSHALRDLYSQRERGEVPSFDRVIIESTGLADPFPILSTVRADPVLSHHFAPGPVIVTVDAVNAGDQRARWPEWSKQVASGDTIVMTKSDLVDAQDTGTLAQTLGRINPTAQIIDIHSSEWSAGGLTSPKALERLAAPKAHGGSLDPDRHPEIDHRHHHHDGGHASKIHAFVITIEQPVDWTAFGIWLTMLLNRHGAKILRMKGILHLSREERPVAVHGVQYLVHPPVHLGTWKEAKRDSQIVFIVDGLAEDAIRNSLQTFLRMSPIQ